MSDNPQPASAQEFGLPGHHVLAITGRDALAFAQALFMNDVASLGDGQWQWNGWLTPKGRVIALFALLRLDAESLWLLLPDADADSLATQLKRFVFRSKVILTPRGDLHAHAAFAPPVQASGSHFAVISDAVELDMGGDGGQRRLRIGPTTFAIDDACASAWARFDLQHGLPRLRDEQVEAWTPQQLSLDRLRAFSVKKGCYPGQEIVARTHFLGQVKRGLALFESDALLAAGIEVRDGERALGQVVATAAGTALAVVPLDRDAALPSVNGTPLREAPLLAGLAR